MLKITVPGRELYDEKTEEFIYQDPVELELEHSLVSLSLWESKWCKPFFGREEKTEEEVLSYVQCMTLTKNAPSDVYYRLSFSNMNDINAYINSKMTATTINNNSGAKHSREIVTSEIIYYWMIALNIPFECQYWHLNRLLMLIDVCNIKNSPKKKMSRKELLSRNRALNEARLAKYNTKG